jgi:hypothetical protein
MTLKGTLEILASDAMLFFLGLTKKVEADLRLRLDALAAVHVLVQA